MTPSQIDTKGMDQLLFGYGWEFKTNHPLCGPFCLSSLLGSLQKVESRGGGLSKRICAILVYSELEFHQVCQFKAIPMGVLYIFFDLS